MNVDESFSLKDFCNTTTTHFTVEKVFYFKEFLLLVELPIPLTELIRSICCEKWSLKVMQLYKKFLQWNEIRNTTEVETVDAVDTYVPVPFYKNIYHRHKGLILLLKYLFYTLGRLTEFIQLPKKNKNVNQNNWQQSLLMRKGSWSIVPLPSRLFANL